MVVDMKPLIIECAEWDCFIQYNYYWLLTLLSLVLLLVFIGVCWLKNRRLNRQVTVVPQAHPPEGISAGAARYVLKKGFDSTVLMAEIVSLAVKGFLGIEYDTKNGYFLVKKEGAGTPPVEYEEDLLKIFFLDSDRVQVARNTEMSRAARYFNNYLMNRFDGDFTWNSYWIHNKFFDVFCAIIAVIVVILFTMVSSRDQLYVMRYSHFFDAVVFALIFADVALAVAGATVHSNVHNDLSMPYTFKGRKCKADLDGFKMFLESTENNQLQGIDALSDKTVQLYENYLPYAMALFVESDWSQQFTYLFEQLKREGKPYVFVGQAKDTVSHGGFEPFGRHFYRAFKKAMPQSVLNPRSMNWYWLILWYWLFIGRKL